MSLKTDPNCRGVIPNVKTSNYVTVAHNLTVVRGFAYDTSVPLETPRSVAAVWRDFVNLVAVSEENPPTASNVASRQAPVCVADQNSLGVLDQKARNSVEESKQEESVDQSTFMELVPVPARETMGQHAAANLDPERDEAFPIELQALLDVLKDEHTDETKFNIKLFNALYTSLQKEGLVEPCVVVPSRTDTTQDPLNTKAQPKPKYIVFKYGQTDTHAIGIAREINAEQKPEHRSRRSRSAADVEKENASGLIANARLDHCSCLLQRDRNGLWTFSDCFATAELKMADAKGCAVIDSTSAIDKELELGGRHGAIAQAMMYTTGWALPGLAKFGQLDEEIPWAVVVAKRLPDSNKRTKTDYENIESNRWVSGKIIVPAECGGPYQYAVTGFGRMDNAATEESVKAALSVYLETILFGIKAAKTSLDFQKTHNGTWPDPCSVSGKDVVIGKQKIQLALRSSATIGMFPNAAATDDHHWDAGQGELFSGSLNIAHLYESLSKGVKANFAVIDETRTVVGGSADIDVVVKVSSRAVHNHLTDPVNNLLALKDIRSDPTVASAISRVLLAVYKKPVGVVTIMADLSSQNYKVLRPGSCGVPLLDLWKAFEVVVKDVLVPLASLEMIHPDIRPGWDVTSNILVQMKDDGRCGNTAIMQVIDYESVVLLEDWKFPTQPVDHRYIERGKGWNALTYLWWQCANVAHAWEYELRQEDMTRVDVQSLVKDGTWASWYENVVVPTKAELTEETFVEVFETLRTMFLPSSSRRALVIPQSERAEDNPVVVTMAESADDNRLVASMTESADGNCPVAPMAESADNDHPEVRMAERGDDDSEESMACFSSKSEKDGKSALSRRC